MFGQLIFITFGTWKTVKVSQQVPDRDVTKKSKLRKKIAKFDDFLRKSCIRIYCELRFCFIWNLLGHQVKGNFLIFTIFTLFFSQSALRSTQFHVRVVQLIGTAFPTWNIATRPSMPLLSKTQETVQLLEIVCVKTSSILEAEKSACKTIVR